MAIGDPFATPIPPVGTSGTAYASRINDILSDVMARLSTKVPVGSIAAAQAGEHLDMNNRPIDNAQYLGLAAQNEVPSGGVGGRLSRYAGNLYYYDVFGAVQITAGPQVNVAGAGGIVGDYGVNGRVVSYEDSTETYHFYDDIAATEYARLRGRTFELYHEGTARTLQIPSPALAESYALTLPASRPAGTALLTMNASGAVAHNAAVGVSPTFSADIVLSGTTKIRHGTRSLFIGIGGAYKTSGGGTLVRTAAGLENSGGTATVHLELTGLLAGHRITGFMVSMFRTSGSATQAWVVRHHAGGPTYSSTGSTTVTGETVLSHTLTTPMTPVSTDRRVLMELFLRDLDIVRGVWIEYDVV